MGALEWLQKHRIGRPHPLRRETARRRRGHDLLVEAQSGIDHAVRREPLLEAPSAGLAEPVSEIGIEEHAGERLGQGAGVTCGNEQTRLLMADDLGNAPDGGGDDRKTEAHRIQEAGPQRFCAGGQAGNGEGLDHPVDVHPETRENAACSQATLPRQPLKSFAQRSRADDHEVRVGHDLEDARHRRQERRVVLVRGEGGYVADDRAARRQSQIAQDVVRPRRGRAIRHAVMDDGQAAPGQPVPQQHPADCRADRDDAVTGRVLPKGQAPAQRECDPPAGDDMGTTAETGGEDGRAGGMRVVSVDD